CHPVVCSAMDQLTFVAKTGQFFLWTAHGSPARSLLGRRLEEVGWATTARLVSEWGDEKADGFLVEMIDALPLLAGAPVGTETPGTLAAWSQVARLGLELVARGHILPRLRPRYAAEGDERVTGWEARWSVVPPTKERGRLAQLVRALGPVPMIVLPERAGGRLAARGLGEQRTLSTRGVILHLLDACADMLVREGAR